MLACEHDFGVSSRTGFEKVELLAAICEGGTELAGRGEAGAAVGGEGGVRGREGQGTGDCGVYLHLGRSRSMEDLYISTDSANGQESVWLRDAAIGVESNTSLEAN